MTESDTDRDNDIDTPPELSIPAPFMRDVILKLRAILAREAEDIPDPGGNASDDEVSASLQEHPDDLLVEELREAVEAMDDDHLAEMVALVWVGRGDYDAGDWDQAVAMANDRHTGPTVDYLMSDPMTAEYLAIGLEALGHDRVLSDGEY